MSKFITLIENKAFITALLTAAASAGAVLGFNVPVATILSLMAPIMVVLGVQSWQVQAKTQLQMQHDHEVKMVTLTQPTRDKQAGASRFTMMLGVFFVGCALVMAIQLARNSTPTATTTGTVDVVEGVALGPAGCATTPPIVTDVVDCLKSEATLVTNGFTVTQVVSAVWGAVSKIASEGIAAVLPLLESLAGEFGPDLVACIVDDYPSAGGGSGSGTGSGSAAPVVAAARFGGAISLDAKAKLLNALAPGKTFNHGKKK